MSAQIFEFSRSGLTPITKQNIPIGQRVREAHKGRIGVVVEDHQIGATVIFPDGDSAHSQRIGARSPYMRITLLDGIASPEEVQQLLAARAQYQEAQRIEGEKAKTAHVQAYEKAVKELRERYPWVTENRASANLKKELTLAFPGVKFSVRYKSFAGGNSVDVDWTLGPTTKEVEAISQKYQDGHFDGMEDIYNYDHSAFGEAVDKVLGRAKYVMESRSFPPELYEQIERDLCTLQRVEYAGTYTRNLMGVNDTFDLRSHVNQLLSRTSFAAGESYAGVEYTPEDEQGGRNWCRIVKTRPAVKESPKQATSEGVTITENTEKNGIEIRFASKPAADVLASLKANGWRWSRFNSCWYARASDEARAFAQQFA